MIFMDASPTQEQWLLAGREHEELGDLVAQSLSGDRR
jgi:hypothetical protein